jgi:signal transduction histidine kinase
MLEERERLSQDLHDGIIQTIYAVGLSLEECQRLMAEDQRLDAIQTVGGAISRLNGAIREIRQFIGGTAPADTTARDLRAELAELAKTVRASRLMQLHVNVDPAVAAQLSSDEAHHLLSIAREAMSNSLRHSHAAWATVKLQARADHIRFELVDDGVGFDPAAVSTGGHGLKNIAARADLIGAGLDVISGSGHGTRIVLNLPKKASHANIHRRRSSAADRR